MKSLVANFKAIFNKIQLRQIFIIGLGSLLLIISTACSSPDMQAKNPNNLPVQAGGANNPYKGGGDKFGNSGMSVEAKEAKRERASLPTDSQKIATNNVANNQKSKLLYPGAETPQGRAEKEAEMPVITAKDFQAKPGGLIQREDDLGERVKGRVNTVKEAVKDASGFLKEKSDEASSSPELQKNPALGR